MASMGARLRALTLALTMCGATLLVALPVAQAATRGRATVGTHYAKIVPVCAPATPGHAGCFALAAEPVKAEATGAVPYAIKASYATGPNGGLTPADFWTAYGLGSQSALTTKGGPGTGQTVAIVDAYVDPNIAADLDSFDAAYDAAPYDYGLPACTTTNGCLKIVDQGGDAPDAGTSGWDVETSLDVETVHATCPNCKIILVEADSSSNVDLGAAVDEAVALGATEVSNSYGGAEGDSAAYDASYETDFRHPGTVLTVSAGDDGYYNWVYDYDGETSDYYPEANVPAAFPVTIAVGGTYLDLSSTPISQSVWNDESVYEEGGATGGGCSTIFPAAPWQSAESGYKLAGCNGYRLNSDVSADGDPRSGFDIYDSYTNPCSGSDWCAIGGTSLASPLTAAMFALAGGSHGVAYPAQTLYDRWNTDRAAFYDVTSGGNGACDNYYTNGCSSTSFPAGWDCGQGDLACNATTGYDGPSGLGTPRGLGAFAVPTTTAVSCSTSKPKTGKATTCTARVSDLPLVVKGASPPTGKVTFASSHGGTFGSGKTCTLKATGTAGVGSCHVSFKPTHTGAITLTGAYGGVLAYGASSGHAALKASKAKHKKKHKKKKKH